MAEAPYVLLAVARSGGNGSVALLAQEFDDLTAAAEAAAWLRNAAALVGAGAAEFQCTTMSRKALDRPGRKVKAAGPVPSAGAGGGGNPASYGTETSAPGSVAARVSRSGGTT